MGLYKNAIRPLLFAAPLDPEALHEGTVALLHFTGQFAALRGILSGGLSVGADALRTEVAGLSFPNPVGLAAGFDKNGVALGALEALGFGFLEIGTVTRLAQPGNPRPRVFRLPADGALINRLGFNNDGADVVALRVAAYRARRVPIGVSIGKSMATPIADAVGDYLYSFDAVYAGADFIALNVSSPNTAGLRSLHAKEALAPLLEQIQARNDALRAGARRKPVFLKVSPDLTEDDLGQVIEVSRAQGLAGLIATNTTIERTGLRTQTSETGGLSGRPLRERSLAAVSFIRRTAPELAIIGVGGIFSGADAAAMLDAGADLIQIYTGFVYEGPSLPGRINRHLIRGRGTK